MGNPPGHSAPWPTELFEDFFWALADHGPPEASTSKPCWGPLTPTTSRRPSSRPTARALSMAVAKGTPSSRACPLPRGRCESERMIAIVDYGIGNLGSASPRRSGTWGRKPVLERRSRGAPQGGHPVVLPGDGAFGAAMDELRPARPPAPCSTRGVGAGLARSSASAWGCSSCSSQSEGARPGSHQGLGHLLRGRDARVQGRPARAPPTWAGTLNPAGGGSRTRCSRGWGRTAPTCISSTLSNDREADRGEALLILCCRRTAPTSRPSWARGTSSACSSIPRSPRCDGLRMLRNFAAVTVAA